MVVSFDMPTDRAKGDPFGAKAFVDDLLVFSQVRVRVRVRVTVRVRVSRRPSGGRWPSRSADCRAPRAAPPGEV